MSRRVHCPAERSKVLASLGRGDVCLVLQLRRMRVDAVS